MANQSTSKKSLRSFNVRDGLWRLFEVKSQEMDCSIDYLINEAMRLYARTHNFASSIRVERPGGGVGATTPAQHAPGSAAPPRPTTGVPPVRPSSSAPGQPPVPAPTPSMPAQAPIPRPGSNGPGFPTIPQAQGPGYAGSVPAPAASGMGSVSAPMPGSGMGPAPGVPGPGMSVPPAEQYRPTLTMIFQGRKLPITTAQFIIGRGSKSSDLAIKDPNISRKHAAIIFHNGAYYLKDLGSTNGIEYKGKQVDSKRIDEGDVFTICGYDLHFTYSV